MIGDVIIHEASNSYIRTDDKLVAAIGVDNLVVLSGKDAVVVADRNRVQEVKIIAERLKASRPEWNHRRSIGLGVNMTR